MMILSKVLGVSGESAAEAYLKNQGYRILEKNFRSKYGEIDLIAQDGKTLCFVEVKTRRSLDQGTPLEALTSWKIRKLSRLALGYLKYKYRSVDILARFDVIAIVCADTGAMSIEHIKNAFDAVCG